ncbi:hypothetical protein A3D03_06330 [Candidatus Gottesmanbacteria bacterium RIFCSPHIGHO2_02_FULL_40_13]|uniref:SIS domain-containing protein n=1 Tax=Candidatus Gottesmanbacteria bacterium RIFCSPHIGHO2_02_FULL_40_13 TaxID=1798384 RepID=A0A1F6A5K9_9BACT|nr:MAG: hypothetical protein A3D03_06330 [Candidatus Gottesmanbacteria bacterium RIFCSPHIGHO2_02_FULL_40_13]
MSKQRKNNQDLSRFIADYRTELNEALSLLDIAQVRKVLEILLGAYHSGRKVFIMGNGGSASNASHFACDIGKGTLKRVYDRKEKRFKVYSLTDNVAQITAFANDLNYDDIFFQQLQNLVEKGDVVIALSGSGNSRNIIKALQYAKKQQVKTIGILGFMNGGKAAKLVDLPIIIKSNKYGICEDIQLILNHIIISWMALVKDGKK